MIKHVVQKKDWDEQKLTNDLHITPHVGLLNYLLFFIPSCFCVFSVSERGTLCILYMLTCESIRIYFLDEVSGDITRNKLRLAYNIS